MSLILDALDKADRQRDTKDAVPDLQTVHPEIKSADYAVVPIWALFALVSLMLTVIMVLLFFLVKSQSPQFDFHATGHEMEYHTELDSVGGKSAYTEASPADPTSLHDDTLQAPVTTPVQGSNRVKPEITTLYKTSPALTAKEVFSANAPQTSGAVNRRDPQIERLYLQKEKEPQEKPQEQQQGQSRLSQSGSQQKSRAIKQTANQVGNTTPLVSDQELQSLWKATESMVLDEPSEPTNPYANIPFLHQLPESFQSRIPTLMYQNHIYSPKASAVIINGKTYRKGDTITADLVIDEITEEALILTYLKKPFRLAALSSWVQG